MNIRLILVVTALLGIAFSCAPEKKQESDLVIMAYYMPNDKEYRPDLLPYEKLSHVIFSFTEVVDNEMKFVEEELAPRLKELVTYREKHPHVKMMIACGGWIGSGGFSDMAADSALRKKFVDSAIDFVVEYDLDGLDIDWEYPGLPGVGNPHKPEDKENFTALMKELREGLDATGKKLELTFAAAGWAIYFEHVEILEVMKYADYINVMTYDLVDEAKFTEHHTNLGNATLEDMKGTPLYDYVISEELDFNPGSAEAIIELIISLGVDSKQIVIGSAFYGRSYAGVPPQNNGLYQPAKGPWNGDTRISNIIDSLENKNGFVRYWDSIAKAPYLYNATDSVFISYDDKEAAKLKTKYAEDMNLGGIMFWEVEIDKPVGGLVDAIYEEANN